jgi:hypothetical protein
MSEAAQPDILHVVSTANTGDDEALWAECMGHWDYGTHGDNYPETF